MLIETGLKNTATRNFMKVHLDASRVFEKLGEMITIKNSPVNLPLKIHTLIDNCEKCPRSANIASEPGNNGSKYKEIRKPI